MKHKRWLFHDWTKWQEYEVSFYLNGASERPWKREIREKRTCETCGHIQVRLVAVLE